MNELIHKGHFHNVGQGLFYSGQFNIYPNKNSRRFNYIIDCGSCDLGNKKGYSDIYRYTLKLEVELYKKNILEDNGNTVDLFVISHMHSDHVNGLLELLKSNIHINKLFLPYLEPSQRLMIYTLFISENNTRKSEYLEFIIDPIEFLKKYDDQIDKIIFISESDNEPPTTSYIRDYNEDSIGKLDNELNKEINKQYSKATVYKQCYIFLDSLIKFYFFRKNVSDLKKLDAFIKELKGIVVDDDYMKSKKNHTKLRNAYKKIFGEKKFNDTSLCVWMTYANKPSSIYEVYERSKGVTNKYEFYDINGFNSPRCEACYYFYDSYDVNLTHLSKKFGYIFPGDIDISKSDDFKFFYSHCKEIANRINIFCVQHHGSKHNWNKELLRLFPYSKWIVSYGTENSHGHPHSIVEDDIRDNDMNIIRVNEQRDFIHKSQLYY